MDSIIIDIIDLPEKFNRSTDVSFHVLLSETGYIESFELVSKFGLIEQLTQTPDKIEHWLAWSAGNKKESGWYFARMQNAKYAIGYFSPLENSVIVELADGPKACAMFIKLVIEEARDLILADNKA